jgi:hypothetical protein
MRPLLILKQICVVGIQVAKLGHRRSQDREGIWLEIKSRKMEREQ